MGLFSRRGKGGMGGGQAAGVDYPPKTDDDAPLSSKEILGSLNGKWSPEDHIDASEAPKQKPQPEAEPLFRPKPEAVLDASALVEKVRTDSPLAMVEELDRYYDAWVHYAQDRNVFNGSPSIKALAQARREAIKLANEKNFDALRAKLEELRDSAIPKVEVAAEESLRRIQEAKESTSAERRQEWEKTKGNVADFESERKKRGKEKKEGDQPELLLTRKEDVRHIEREEKAARLAEKYDITAEREKLLFAEEEYAAAIRNRQKKFFSLKFRDAAETRDQQAGLESAMREWRAALSMAGAKAKEEGSVQDRISLRYISARDTMMRIEKTRQNAVAEGLDDRSKTVLGKIDGWAQKLNGKLLKGASWLGDKFGKGTEWVGGKAIGAIADKELFSKESSPEKFKRASRIVGSAAVMTAVFAPFGAIAAGAVGTAFLWRTARGLLGWGAGAAAGSSTGNLYDRLYGSKEKRSKNFETSQKDLIAALRDDTMLEQMDPKLLAQIYAEGNKADFLKNEEKHDKRRMKAQIGATVLVAGLSSYEFAHWQSVHDAVNTVSNPNMSGSGASGSYGGSVGGPTGGSVEAGGPTHDTVSTHSTGPAHSGPEAKASGGTAAAPETGAGVHVEAVTAGGHVNDADRMLGRFVDNLRHQFPDPKSAPPALRSLMESSKVGVHGTTEQDLLTKFLHLQNGESVTVHPGDTIAYEHGKVMFQGHTLVDEKGTLHNLREEGVIRMQPHHGQGAHTPEHARPHAAPEHVTPAPPQPEAAAVQPAEIHAAEQPHGHVQRVHSDPVVDVRPQEIHTEPSHGRIERVHSAPEIQPEQHTDTISHGRIERVRTSIPMPIHEAAPVHIPQPSNDNVPHPPGHVEAVRTQAPHITQHTETAVPSAEHIITNHFGLKIDTLKPHIYAPEGTDEQVYILYGGSAEDRQAFLDKYFQDPEYSGHPLLTPAINPADPSGRQVLVAYGMNANQSQMIPVPAMDPKGHQLYFKGVEEFESIIL